MLTDAIIIKRKDSYLAWQKDNLIFLTETEPEKLLKITGKTNYEFSKKQLDMKFVQLANKIYKKRSFTADINKIEDEDYTCFADKTGKIVVDKNDFIEVKKEDTEQSLIKINKNVLIIAKEIEENPKVIIYEKTVKYNFPNYRLAIFELLDSTDEINIAIDMSEEELLSIKKEDLIEIVKISKTAKIRIRCKNNKIYVKPLRYYVDFRKEDKHQNYIEKKIEGDAEFDFTIDIPIKIIKEILKRKAEYFINIKENKKMWIINNNFIFPKKSSGTFY